jgi:hypothetical protein
MLSPTEFRGNRRLCTHRGADAKLSRQVGFLCLESSSGISPTILHQKTQEPQMSTIHLHRTTTLTPDQYIAGLTDFGPGRSKLFGNSAEEYLKVHHLGPAQADVTEGSGGIWERLHYNWSDPNRVVLTTTDSNAWGGASGHTYTFTRRPNATTDIDVVVVRDGKNLKGWILGFVLGTIGRGVLERAFENSVKAIEVRNGALNHRDRIAA